MKILFATDGSEAAAGAQSFLAALPLPAGSTVCVLSVLTDPILPSGAYMDGVFPESVGFQMLQQREREWAERAVDAAAEMLARPGVQVTKTLRDGDAAAEILAAARELGVDLVVVGSKGLTGIDSFLLGSVARNVAKHSKQPVLVAHAPRAGLKAIVVATDGSEHARHAVELAAGFPVPAGAHFVVVNVVKPYTPFPGLFPADLEDFDATVLETRRKQREVAEALAAEQAGPLDRSGRGVSVEVREGDPASEILALAEERGADLIVAGARGVSLIEGLLVGSVADRLLKKAECSVLLVH